MALDTLQDLFEEQMKDLYNAENQLTKALPKMAKKASSDELRMAFENHLKETMVHVERVSQIADMLGFKPSGKTCKAMKGLIEEGKEILEEDGQPGVIDFGLVEAAQRVEHYEIAAYGNAVVIAQQLKLDRKIIDMLKSTLNDEETADKKLTQVTQESIIPSIPIGEESDA